MLNIGKLNQLLVKSKTSAGIYLEDGHESVFLPARFVPENIQTGQPMGVFIYLDASNKPVATTQMPKAQVGEFAFLHVKDVTTHGAFLDWGIPKDLFVPFKEQRFPLEPGMEILVYIYIDEHSGRITATSKWENFLQEDSGGLEEGMEVRLLIADATPIGFRAIIDNRQEGLLYRNEVFQPLHPGDICKGYVKYIREDGKIDLSLQQQGFKNILDTRNLILDKLKEHHGVLALGDKSDPEEIVKLLRISKKVFKKTVGTLYKEGLIVPGDYEIRLSDPRGE